MPFLDDLGAARIRFFPTLKRPAGAPEHIVSTRETLDSGIFLAGRSDDLVDALVLAKRRVWKPRTHLIGPTRDPVEVRAEAAVLILGGAREPFDFMTLPKLERFAFAYGAPVKTAEQCAPPPKEVADRWEVVRLELATLEAWEGT